MLGRRRRYLMALTGVIPAVAISGGLLTLPAESVTRQQYWPWLSLLVLGAGLAFSCFFWLFLAGRNDRQDDDKPQ